MEKIINFTFKVLGVIGMCIVVPISFVMSFVYHFPKYLIKGQE